MHIKDAQLYKIILTKADQYLSAKADPQNVQKYQRYFKEGYNVWGAQQSDIAALCGMIREDYPSLSLEQLIELGTLLFQHGKYEMGSLAIMLVEQGKKEYDRSSFAGIKQWFDFGVNNWAHADYLCSKVNPVFLTRGIVKIDDFLPWRDSDSRWTRRAAPVSFIKIKKETDPQILLSFVNPLMTDGERVVHQGTGWFLRELWKVHPHEVEDFLYLHRNSAARLIIRYATEKLSKEERLRFRKDKPVQS